MFLNTPTLFKTNTSHTHTHFLSLSQSLTPLTQQSHTWTRCTTVVDWATLESNERTNPRRKPEHRWWSRHVPKGVPGSLVAPFRCGLTRVHVQWVRHTPSVLRDFLHWHDLSRRFSNTQLGRSELCPFTFSICYHFSLLDALLSHLFPHICLCMFIYIFHNSNLLLPHRAVLFSQ